MQAPHLVPLQDDAALALAIAAASPGVDTQAEAELYRRLAPRVRLYGLRHLRDRHAAADLAQQVLLMTLERLRAGKVRQPEKLASFVLGMCRMVVLDIKRGTARREELLQTYGDLGEAIDPPEPQAIGTAALSGCLDKLSERERSVLILSFFADKPGEQVARELGLTPVNARVIRHRALTRLRGCLEKKTVES